MTWATSVPILVFPGFSVLDLGPMYVTDRRQTDIRQKHIICLMPPALWAGHNKFKCSIDQAKRAFFVAANSIFAKVGRLASEEVIVQLLTQKKFANFLIWSICM